MELRECIRIVQKRILIIIIITLFSTLSSTVVSYFVLKPTYKADISVIIGNPNKSGAVNYNDVIMYQKLVKTYGELTKSRLVAEHVIKELNLDMTPKELQEMLSVAPKGDTEFITISVKSRYPEQAMKIANQLADSLDEIALEVRKEDYVQRLDEALLPTRPDSPRPLLNIAIAFFMGLMVSVGIVFLIEYLDNTVKDQEEVEKLVGIPVIGIIPMIKDKA
jgi:capsular polysaccharide biosynthesis protein